MEKIEYQDDHTILTLQCNRCLITETIKDDTIADCYWSADFGGWEEISDHVWYCPRCVEILNH